MPPSPAFAGELGEGLASPIMTPMFPVRRQISPHAARLRRAQTDVERRFWSAVRDRQLGGYKFRRQVTIDRYIVDFLCVEAMLIVELDGGQHDAEVDRGRTIALEQRGYAIMRFWNNEVVDSPAAVLAAVLDAVARRVTGQK